MAYWPLLTAIRYARSGVGDKLVSSMTTISVAGLVLGVAVLVIVLSVMNGFERELRERVLGVMPHGVLSKSSGFSDWRETAADLEQHPEVVAIAPIEEGNVLLVGHGKVNGVGYAGIDPATEPGVSILDRYFIEGSLANLSQGDFNLVVGAVLARRLNLTVGEKVTLVMPEAQITLAGPIPRTKRFTVVGIFEVGSDVDKNQVYMHVADALKLGRKGRIDTLRIKMVDLFDAPRVLQELARTMPHDDFYGNSWMRRHGNLYDAIQTQKSTLFLLLLMLIAVAAFNLVSNLVMIVNEKQGDVAILRTMGASTGQILMIFVFQGVAIGTAGVVVGLFIGCLVANYITEVYAFIDGLLQLGIMDEYFIHYLPSEILLADLMKISFVSLLISFIATLYPSYVAGRADPVEALRYE